MRDHHPSCPKAQFWDGGESVPCECQRGWPKKAEVCRELRDDGLHCWRDLPCAAHPPSDPRVTK